VQRTTLLLHTYVSSVIYLLYFFATFEITDHNILITRLSPGVVYTWLFLNWFKILTCTPWVKRNCDTIHSFI